MGLQIYIASSWKNQHAVEMLTERLEQHGHNVVSFVREAAETEGRVHFGTFDLKEWLVSDDALRKFIFDTDGATKSDLVIYVGPSGTDAWAEVGAAWGAGVPIVGLWAKGEPAGLMRHMMRSWHKDYRTLLEAISRHAETRIACGREREKRHVQDRKDAVEGVQEKWEA